MTALVMGFATSVIYSSTAPSVFEGRVQLLVEPNRPNPAGFKDVTDQPQTDDFYRTQYRLIQSRSVARMALRSLGITDPRTVEREVSTARSLPFHLRFGPPPDDNAPAADPSDESPAVDLFLRGVRVSPVGGTRLVSVAYEARSAEFAARAANAVAQAYVQRSAETRAQTLDETAAWLRTRLDEQRKRVEVAELALQQYREQHNAVSLADRQNIVVQKLADVNATLTKAKTERIQKEAVYQQLMQYKANAELTDAPTFLATPAVQQTRSELTELQREEALLSQRFGDRHPQVIKTRTAIGVTEKHLRAELEKAIQGIRSEYEIALAQERGLSMALNQQKDEAMALNRLAIDDAALERNVASARQVLNSLLERTSQNDVARPAGTIGTQVVDAADVPRSPVRPDRRHDLFVALVFGIGFAVCGVYLLDTYDNRLTCRDDIETHLGLALLGSLPLERRRRKSTSPLIDQQGVTSPFAEAFNTLRTNIIFSHVKPHSYTIAVTSTNSGEGKSVVAGNLAIALAQTGSRVALIDADMRRPVLHDRLDRPRDPGLSNVLSDQCTRHETLKETAMKGLWLMPAGYLPPQPSHLLASNGFRELLHSLEREFDWVVIDTPPLLAVADAAIVSATTGSVVFVVAADATSRQDAANALAQLSAARARVTGVILNRVDVKRYPHYYRQYERSAYQQYLRRTPEPFVAGRGGADVSGRVLCLNR
jgi:capsular exopolysaccharide synthesis family protein